MHSSEVPSASHLNLLCSTANIWHPAVLILAFALEHTCHCLERISDLITHVQRRIFAPNIQDRFVEMFVWWCLSFGVWRNSNKAVKLKLVNFAFFYHWWRSVLVWFDSTNPANAQWQAKRTRRTERRAPGWGEGQGCCSYDVNPSAAENASCYSTELLPPCVESTNK